jgi:proline iminopeptidase
MLQPLADSGYDVYLYDQVGSGRSSRLENIRDYTVQKTY